ncbi:MAG: ABC transporter permease [Candidatus Aminicenantes bacterium]|nr:ABC transporter permease [Candidatus Aminicenantes bacterium]
MSGNFRHPPKLANWVVEHFLPASERPFLNGDFDEIYNDIFDEKGHGAAFRWYWAQIARSLPQIFFQYLSWSVIMFKNYLKTTLRNLQRHKGYSLLNIAGLAVGMACFVLILLYVRYEFSYEENNHQASHVYHIYVEHTKTDEIYRVRSTPVPLVEALHDEVPGIESYTRIDSFPKTLVSAENKKFYETGMVCVDPGVFDVFGFRLLLGDKKTALEKVNTAVVTEQIAEKYFGKENPVGKNLVLGSSLPIMVTGVIINHPPNTDIDPDILVSFKTAEELSGEDYTNNWLSQVLQSYILVPGEDSIENLEDKIEACFSKYRAKEGDDRILRVERLSRIHLFSVFGEGNFRTIQIFLGVGFLILLTACINFMNLATARSAGRAREVGMRKVVGARRKQLITQFLGESFISAVLSLVLALMLVAALIPAVKNITGQAIRFDQIGQPAIMLGLLGALILTGLLSGSYPALFLSAFQPAPVLRGMVKSGKKGAGFRKILVVSQFCISIILIISTFIFTRQIHFMRNKSLGFTRDQIVVVQNQGRTLRNVEPLKQALKENPNILSVTSSMMLPHRISMYNDVTWEGAPADENIAIQHNTVDYDFLETFQIPLIAGRNFSPDIPSDKRGATRDPKNAGNIILNEEAVKRFGWENPIGRKVIQVFGELRITYTVIGVVRDFHYSSLKNPIGPLKIFLNNRSPLGYISVRIKPQNVQETLAFMEKEWQQINTGYPFEHYFYDSVFERQYQSEKSLQTLFGYFSFLAVFIACLGLFGLASFAAERRTKEVGIRKVFGASSREVVFLLTKDFSKWVLLANIIAWPVAFYAMSRWLGGFAYHIDILRNWHVFFVSGVLALVIAWITVGYQAAKAAVNNPVNSLRNE